MNWTLTNTNYFNAAEIHLIIKIRIISLVHITTIENWGSTSSFFPKVHPIDTFKNLKKSLKFQKLQLLLSFFKLKKFKFHLNEN